MNRISKKISLVLFIISFFFVIPLFAQQFNNEWINYDQRYFKVSISKTGLYKLGYRKLIDAGIPVNTINPKNIQLFQKGVELPVYFPGESDGVFDVQDYLIFYAEKNTCKEDSGLFSYGSFLANPYHSVINDTAAVFITWNNANSNRRFEIFSDTVFTNRNPLPYYWKEEVVSFNNDYHAGPQNSTGTTDPGYALGEGLISSTFIMGQSNLVNFKTSNLLRNTLPVYLSVVHSGLSNPSINPDKLVSVEFQKKDISWSKLTEYSYDGFKTFKNDFILNSADIGDQLNIKLNNLASAEFDANSTRIGVHYYKLTYPSTFQFTSSEEQVLTIPNIFNETKSYLEISGFIQQNSQAVLIDLSSQKWIIPSFQNGKIRCNVLNTIGSKKYLLSSLQAIDTTIFAIPVNETGFFTNYLQNSQSKETFLIVTHPLFMNAAKKYADYRSSNAGGNYQVILASIHDLYNQFSFGVNFNPMAIKNFCAYLKNYLPLAPSNLFLIGKSIHQPQLLILANASASTIAAKREIARLNYVPSYGYPAADNLLTQGIANFSSLAPEIPTGRISALSDTDVSNYLNKVIAYESQPKAQSWQKNILHLVGGTSAPQQKLFEQYMDNYAKTAADTSWGAKTFTFKKTGSAPISMAANDSLKKLINNGLGLITFFGHGAVNGFEHNIDDPDTYKNAPRFPLLISNSCYTGDYHLPGVSCASENFVLSPTGGTIGFLATISSGIIYALNIYTDEFYKNYSKRHYGATFGRLVKETVKSTQQLPFTNSDSLLKTTIKEISLQGDPSIRPMVSAKPDYALFQEDISIDTDRKVDSIEIAINVKNLGKAIEDSIQLYVQRILPNGESKNFYHTIKAPAYQEHIKLTIEKDIVNGIGLNKFYFHIDHYNKIDEVSETNNSTNGYLTSIVKGADISPIYPYPYAIVPVIDKITLKVNTVDPIAPMTSYRIQLDTSDSFLNPLVNTVINTSGGVIPIPVTLLNKDSTVYFWRIGKDSSFMVWRESSFQTIKNRKGWSQAHFHQFKNNSYEFVTYNKPQRRFEFRNTLHSVFCRTGTVGSPNPPYLYYNENAYFFNSAQQNAYSCGRSAGWSFALFDTLSGVPLFARKKDTLQNGTYLTTFESCSCVENDRTVFDFSMYNACNDNLGNKTIYFQRLENMLNSIPNGMKVLAYSRNSDPTSEYPPSLIEAFRKIGSDSILVKKDTTNIIIFGTKRSVAHFDAKEVLGKNYLDIITLYDTLSSKWDNGYVKSERIGPSSSWKSLHWNFGTSDTKNGDKITLKIIGIKLNGIQDTLATFTSDSLNVFNLNNYVNASTYPYIELIAYESDKINYTPPQLKKWQVLYDEMPECAINIQKKYRIYPNPVNEGEQIEIQIGVENIGEIDFNDSLVISYKIEDAKGLMHLLPQKFKRDRFIAGTFFIDTVLVNTNTYTGKNALWIEVNPINQPKYQAEKFSFNNFVRIPFEVYGDKTNPILDVTFNGVHILNGDIISPNPTIEISLKDENKFLALNDTSDFLIYLKSPNATTESKIHFKDNMIFTPAQLPNNSCRINYSPNNLIDGTYLLRVQAKDRSENLSGSNYYTIEFEVINKSSITEVLNYPNPFSTSTRFVFTLTGNEIPETFRIQIMTVSGKVVKEIEKEELGTIRIGRNITEYAWNGKDEFGDLLANGVYLYRIITKIDNESIEKRATSADDYFKNGWGKLIIIR